MIKRTALVVTIFILTLSTSAIAAELGNGIIEGSLVNGTEGGSSLVNQDIILITYLNKTEVGSTISKTDTEGKFQFRGLSTNFDHSFQIRLRYQEAEYASEWLSFNAGETIKSVKLIIYDSTMDDGAIKVAMSHTIVYVERGSFQVKEYFLFVNEGNRTYIGSKEVAAGGKKETLRFSLPKEATELRYTLGLIECCLIRTEEGLVSTVPLKPGATEVVFSYRLNYDSGAYTFSKKVNYPTANFDLLVQGEGIEVVSDQLTMEEPLDIGGIRFIHLSGKNLNKGITLEARLSRLPEMDIQRLLVWAVVGLIVLVTGFGLGYPLMRKRLQLVSPEGSLNQTRRSLLLEIAQLDDDFEDGKISEEVYRKIRAVKKRQLVELMHSLKEKRGGGDRK